MGDEQKDSADILSALSCIRGSWDWVGTAVESGCLSEGGGNWVGVLVF